MPTATPATFKAKLLRPAQPGMDGSWSFLILPKSASDTLPRRGRTTVAGTLNGHPFQATLDPDGQLSHWLKVDDALREAAGVKIGETVAVQIAALSPEPEPLLPDDLRDALAAAPDAKLAWEGVTTLARLDWIHWIESAKQAKTRRSRVAAACNMLLEGKQRVCCFDASGFYSKSLSTPRAAD